MDDSQEQFHHKSQCFFLLFQGLERDQSINNDSKKILKQKHGSPLFPRYWLSSFISNTKTWTYFLFCGSYCISFKWFIIRIQECYRNSHPVVNTSPCFSKVVSELLLEQEDCHQYFAAFSPPWNVKDWNILNNEPRGNILLGKEV